VCAAPLRASRTAPTAAVDIMALDDADATAQLMLHLRIGAGALQARARA
jgi:hypothetical protein